MYKHLSSKCLNSLNIIHRPILEASPAPTSVLASGSLLLGGRRAELAARRAGSRQIGLLVGGLCPNLGTDLG